MTYFLLQVKKFYQLFLKAKKIHIDKIVLIIYTNYKFNLKRRLIMDSDGSQIICKTSNKL